MANYNSGFLYNNRINYNSATYYIVEVSNAGQGEELIHILANKPISDEGIGTESVSPLKFPAETYFVITCEGRLNPLGVIVLGDSREELAPSTRDNTEEVPGMPGEHDFGSELKSKLRELHVATDDGLTILQREQLKRTIAGYLDPTKGTKKLVYLDDIDVEYEVKYAGKIDLTKYSNWMEFTIPFKSCNPLTESRDEHSLAGNGTITNAGTFEVPLTIEIAGPVTNPSVVIGSETCAYTGTINEGQTLVIVTGGKGGMTAKIGETNAAATYNKVFPMLQPGSTSVVAGNNVTIRWSDKWL